MAGVTATVALSYTPPTTGGPRTLYAVADPNNAIVESDEADNTGKVAAFGPDLALTDASVEPWGGHNVGLHTLIQNIGTSAAPTSTLAFYSDALTGTLEATDTVPSLAPGQSITLTTPWTYGALTSGSYPLVAAVNQRDFPETFGDNNAYIATLDEQPDLAVSPYDLYATSLPDGRVAITATVYNVGNVAASPADIAVYADTPFTTSAIVTQSTLPSLEPGAATTFTTTWNAPAPGPHTVYVFVNESHAVTETTWDNNLVSADISSTSTTGASTATPSATAQTPTPAATATPFPLSTTALPATTAATPTSTDTGTPMSTSTSSSTPTITLTPTATSTPAATATVPPAVTAPATLTAIPTGGARPRASRYQHQYRRGVYADIRFARNDGCRGGVAGWWVRRVARVRGERATLRLARACPHGFTDVGCCSVATVGRAGIHLLGLSMGCALEVYRARMGDWLPVHALCCLRTSTGYSHRARRAGRTCLPYDAYLPLDPSQPAAVSGNSRRWRDHHDGDGRRNP